jgi:hypothetical protein
LKWFFFGFPEELRDGGKDLLQGYAAEAATQQLQTTTTQSRRRQRDRWARACADLDKTDTRCGKPPSSSAGRRSATAEGRRGKWDNWAVAYGRGLRRILLLHRDGAKMVSGTRLTDNSLYAQMELSLRTLVDAGFSPKLSIAALSTIYSYVVGFVIEEQAVYPQPGKRDEFYGPQQRGHRIDADKFPLALQAGDLFSNFDQHFEEGLKLIISGIATRKPAKRRRS